jgi:hypothetical protein
MDSPDYDIQGEDFQDEMGAYLRAGGGVHIGLVGPEGKIDQATLDPLDRFKIIVDATARNLMDSNIYIIESDIGILLETASKLQYVHYKNPTAYLLGYIASSRGSKINKKQFNYTIDMALPLIEDSSVFPPDVLRYSRLWLNL